MESLLSLLLKHHPLCSSLVPVFITYIEKPPASHIPCFQLSLQHKGSVDHKEVYYVCLVLSPNSEKQIAEKLANKRGLDISFNFKRTNSSISGAY